ncbi:hypothetical protein TWF281_003285 [Arthrobotrys megalospora]
MAAPIPTVALISGGKDSFFSLLHSNANGFHVIALANLHPPVPSSQTSDNDDSDDLNSFMYQTVGHTVLPHYASILGIPLYRAPITGSSVNQDLSYHPSTTNSNSESGKSEEEDEIENLYALLHSIKLKHPELKAVCSGAILSSYQRTRVESVCQRLGLISIAWLWQRKQERVLREMEVVGLDARIIKVASLGLDERWLGRGVADYKTRMALEGIKKKYGGNVAGEGGEFETLVMGCRGWKQRVEAIKSEVVNEGGGVAWMRFLDTKVVDVEEEKDMVAPEKPPVLDMEFERILQTLKGMENPIHQGISPQVPRAPTESFRTTVQISPRNIYVANLHNSLGNIPEQVDSIFSQLQEQLSKSSSSLRQITSTLLLLRSMDDFQAINKVYSSYFSDFPNPPSRVCVAIGDAMPQNIGVLLSVIADTPEHGDTRKALHVQSRSYWAPANVGPYSQATAVGGVVSVAGMVGLLPESMKVWESEGVKGETVLALQSMVRVGREMSIHGQYGWLGGVGFVVDGADVAGMKGAWKDWFEEPEEEDDGDTDEEVNEGYFEKSDEDIQSPSISRPGLSPPLVIVRVPQLPVGSHVEFACQGLDSAFLNRAAAVAADEDNSDEDDSAAPMQSSSILRLERTSSEAYNVGLQYHSVSFSLQQLVWGVLDEGGGEVDGITIITTKISILRKEGYKSVSLTLYLSPQLWEHANNLIGRLAEVGFEGVCCVPTFGVWWAGDNDAKKQREYRMGFAMRAVKG